MVDKCRDFVASYHTGVEHQHSIVSGSKYGVPYLAPPWLERACIGLSELLLYCCCCRTMRGRVVTASTRGHRWNGLAARDLRAKDQLRSITEVFRQQWRRSAVPTATFL